MNLLLIWLLFAMIIASDSKHSGGFEIFRTDNGSFVLVRTEKTLHRIPDKETAESLYEGDLNNVTALPVDLHTVPIKGIVASLKQNPPCHDEFIRTTLAKILIVAPPTYIKDMVLIPSKEKAAILKLDWWSKENYLVVWNPRIGLQNFLYFGSMDQKSFNNITRMENMSMPLTYNGQEYLQQEARIFARNSEKSVFVICTARIFKARLNSWGNWFQVFSFAKLNEVTGDFEFGPTLTLDYGADRDSKNFIPFDYQGKIFLIPSINPMTIISIESIDYRTNKATVKEVFQGPEVKLPWSDEYGTGFRLRGGTPAVLVRGLYLTFFHTRTASMVNGVDHYFMGAMTLCPHYPFNIHTMSAYPIIPSTSLYDGPWLNKVASYVVLPMGIIVEDDEKYVLISMGHQDRDFYVIRMNIAELYSSLDFVAHCEHHPLPG